MHKNPNFEMQFGKFLLLNTVKYVCSRLAALSESQPTNFFDSGRITNLHIRGISGRGHCAGYTEPVFLNVYGAQESIPRNEFRQPM